MKIGPTKRQKIRTVDFCDTLAEILQEARKEQLVNSLKYGPLYMQNYYRQIKKKNRTYYEVCFLNRESETPLDYTPITFACQRPEDSYVSPCSVEIA